MREVTVKDKEKSISGSKAILARAATNGLDKAAPGVLSFVREWRAGQVADAGGSPHNLAAEATQQDRVATYNETG